jgi:hypothetical protein
MTWAELPPALPYRSRCLISSKVALEQSQLESALSIKAAQHLKQSGAE